MHKTHTLPNATRGCVVFGPLTGRAKPRAGLFTKAAIGDIADAAHIAGLATMDLSSVAMRAVQGRLPPGSVARNGQLRLRTVPDALVRELQAMRRAQPNKRRKASEGDSQGGTAKLDGAPLPASPTNPPPADLNLGPDVLGAYRLLEAVGDWFERLGTEFTTILKSIGKASDFSFPGQPLAVSSDAFAGGHGWVWVYDGWHWTLPGRYQRQRIGALSFVIDIGRPGRPANALGQPCALVVWSGVAHDWLPAVCNASGLWPPAPETTRLLASRLVQWAGTPPGNGPASALPLRSGSWFYVLPLTALTSFTQLRSLVVQPALELLKGTPAEAAFATTPEVLRFARRKGELVITG